ncbi:MAG: MFS transporter [Anaerolineae bacterium]
MTQRSQHAIANPYVILGLICLPVFIGSLDLTIVSAFLPEIVVKLGLPLQTALDDAAWVVSGYLLAYAISMMFMGRVSDLIGRRKVYIVCLLIFVAGSVLVATAHTWPTDLLYTIARRLQQRPPKEEMTLLAIIIGRVIQALGAGALVPVSLALVGDLFPPERRAQPLGIIGAVDTLGWVLGHLYGGILVNFFATHQQTFTDLLQGIGWPAPDWRTLFWINVPLTIIGLGFTLWALRNVKERRASGRFDFIGALLIGAALVALVVGLGGNVDISMAPTNANDINRLPPLNGGALVVAGLCFAGFLLIETRLRDPLIQLKLFRRRNLAAGAIINLFIGFCLMIGLVAVPILVNVRIEDATLLSEAALQTGILLSALTVPMALAAIPGGWLSDRIGLQRTTTLGLALAIVGFVLVWQTWDLEMANGLVALEMAFVGVGIGLTFSPISAAVINSADEDNRGVASALVIILRLIGMTVAVAALTTYSLNRINQLAGASLDSAQSASDALQFVNTYATMTIKVLAELGLLGAVICAVALIPAWWGLPRKHL